MSGPDLYSRLSAALYALDTPLPRLPVAGFLPSNLSHPRPSAVLIGMVDDRDPRIILTRRSQRVSRHAGQVAFPGGGREADDRSAVETALREAREEAGIDPAKVRPAGYLGRYDTISGYRITAVVATVEPGTELKADGIEADQVFTVALSRVLTAQAWRREPFIHEGRRIEILTLRHPEHHIWGATAALLFELGRSLGSSGLPDVDPVQ